jgi:hypothetical protein
MRSSGVRAAAAGTHDRFRRPWIRITATRNLHRKSFKIFMAYRDGIKISGVPQGASTIASWSYRAQITPP